MEISIVLTKIYLILSAIATVCLIGVERQPTDKVTAVIGLTVIGWFYYLISQ